LGSGGVINMLLREKSGGSSRNKVERLSSVFFLPDDAGVATTPVQSEV
jgi:hypothetical protein